MQQVVIKAARNHSGQIEAFEAKTGESIGIFPTVNSFKKEHPAAIIIQNTSNDQRFKSELKGTFIYVSGQIRKVINHNLKTGEIEWHAGRDQAQNLIPNPRKNSTAKFELKTKPK